MISWVINNLKSAICYVFIKFKWAANDQTMSDQSFSHILCLILCHTYKKPLYNHIFVHSTVFGNGHCSY